jgi:hypothetical protein
MFSIADTQGAKHLAPIDNRDLIEQKAAFLRNQNRSCEFWVLGESVHCGAYGSRAIG